MTKPPEKSKVVRKLRCAVYTRKSSEEGLEQEFNSLHAQREACEAYIASQRSEGWVLVRDQYDDGGISGGTLERPGLKRLLEDIEDGLVDVVVVYKIDRLSRSLADFAKLVEVFDRNGVTFVSVTQSFNTTTSMGRLTLNILLSFAQFEREVTAERIRDKVAASRKKGMWMGGVPPYGYRVESRKLVIDEESAGHVRWIFARFLEIGSATELAREVGTRGIRTPRDNRIDKKYIYRMLSNRAYIGEAVHKGDSYPGEEKLSSALGDLAGVARLDGVDGQPMDWVAILQGELRFAREAQDQLPALANREVEQAVIGTFLHSQPQGPNHARITDLYALTGAAKPDRIALEKGIQAWAERSWFLDEVHLESADKRPDGSRGLPKTWRLGFQPNLKQMHDEAKVNRVPKTAVDDMLLEEIKAAKWLDAGATALGAKVHKLPTGADQVPSDGEFRYVILGPSAQSESGKPSALTVRFCEEVTGPQNPRAAKNAIVIAAPDRSGLAIAQEKVKDHLAWLEVKSLLSGQPIDPVRSSKLDSEITGSKKDIAGAVRQAYCIVVTRGTDDVVHAFKVTVDTSKPLFQTIKEDPKARITDLPLTPDAILPGSTSGFDLWREDEDRRRVKTIVGAFAERPKLPKMLRRKDLLDTVSNGCGQGLYVLSLPRPDGSARTWWRMPIDEAALADDALEAVQNSAAVLDGLDPSLLAPGRLEGLDWKNGVKIADLVSYFDGHTLTIDHPDEGWTEQKPIPRCPEAKVLDAVSTAVKNGAVWITSGAASVWGDAPPVGIISKTAVLRTPPDPISVSSLTPEALPDAWTDGKASVHSIEQALAAQRGVISLPWKLVEAAITAAMNSGFIRVIPGGVAWPCQPHEAAAVQIGLPEAPKAKGDTKKQEFAEDQVPGPKQKAAFREAILDSSQLTELVEGMGDVLAAAGNLTLRFRVAVEFAEGEVAPPDVAAKLAAALDKAGIGVG